MADNNPIDIRSVGFRRESYAASDITGGKGQYNVLLDHRRLPSDGWLAGLGVHAAGNQMTTPAALVLYDADSGHLIHRGGVEDWSSTLADRTVEVNRSKNKIAIRGGRDLLVGFWGDRDFERKFSLIPRIGGHRRYTTNSGNYPPDHISSWDSFEGSLAAWIDYIPQRPPNNGRWVDVPVGEITDFNPRFEGTMPQDPREGGMDRPDAVHMRIYDQTLDKWVFNRIREVTPWERDNERFVWKDAYTHEADHAYYVEFRHRDSWGEWNKAGFFDRSTYKTGNGPFKPEIVSPLEGTVLRTLNPTYSGNYNHPNGTPGKDVRIEIWNGTSDVLLQDTGWWPFDSSNYSFSKSATAGWLTSLDRDRVYTWRARFRDQLDVPGQWSDFVRFRTNAAPYMPERLRPGRGDTTGNSELSVVVNDKNGDDLQWVKFRVEDLTTGTVVHSGLQVNGPFPSGSTVSRDFASSLVLTRRYQWEAWAYDGWLESEHSDVQQFVYDAVPEIASLTPQYNGLTNKITNPSFEYVTEDGALLGWTLDDSSEAMSMERVLSADSASGDFRLECTRSSFESPGGTVATDWRPIDPARPIVAYAHLKRLLGDADSSVVVQFSNGSGAVLGQYIPDDFAGGLAGAQPTDYWQNYGGFVPIASYPAGSTYARVIVYPSNTLAGTVAVDAAFLANIPSGANNAESSGWLGYFDGDSALYGTDDDYFYNGEPGYSSSSGLNVLTVPNPKVPITYFSKTGAAKKDDRIIIERGGPDVYGNFVPHYDSNWVASNRLTIPIRSTVLRNEERYRMQIQCRDTNNLVGKTDWIEFDTSYDGPAELVVLQAASDASRAELVITWEPSQLDQIEFVAFEVAVEDESGEQVIFDRIHDHTATTARYPWPLSGKPYKLRVRQVQDVGAVEIEGRWAGGEALVDYLPHFVAKDLEDPSKMFFFEPLRGTLPSTESNDPADTYEPLLATKPSHVVGPMRWRSGSFEATIFPDSLLTGDPEFYQKVMVGMEYGTRKACVLGQAPASKHFVYLKTIGHGTNDALDPTVSVTWEETDYREDHRDRQ